MGKKNFLESGIRIDSLQDFANDLDPQLDRAIAEALRMIEERPSLEPKPEERPRKVWR